MSSWIESSIRKLVSADEDSPAINSTCLTGHEDTVLLSAISSLPNSALSVALQVTHEVGQCVERYGDGVLGFSCQREAFTGRAARRRERWNDEVPKTSAHSGIRTVEFLGCDIGLLDQEVD